MNSSQDSTSFFIWQRIMKRMLCLISALLIPFAAYGQPIDKRAVLYFYNGCDKVFTKDYKGAIYDFSEALKIDSSFIQAYENRGVAKFYLNDHRGAIADYDKALEINPNDHNTYGRRGWAKFYLHDYTGAIADFSGALEGRWNDARYYNIRGEARYILRDYEGAFNDFNKVIKSWIGDTYQRSKAFYWRGLAKINLGHNESGCRDLSRAAKAGYKKAYEAIKGYCQ